jgi:DNA replication protein DnaC
MTFVKIGDSLKTATEKKVCEIHGEYSSTLWFGRWWSPCPVCSEERSLKKEEEEKAQKEIEDRERKIVAWQKKLGISGIPDRFKEKTLSTFKAENEAQKKAFTICQKYADEFDFVMKTGKSGLFIGKPGTGKTHLSVGIALSALEKGHTVLFTTVLRAIRRIKDTWSKGSEESESEAIDAFVYPDLLILDEVGVQFGSEFEKNMLFDILNERYEKRKPSILLSNLEVSEVKEYLGERIFDRLREDGGMRIAFTWDSHRGRLNV